MTLTGLPIFIEEILFAAIIIFVTTLIYKFLINQNEIRELKEKLKEKQAKTKELQKTNPEEAKRIMTETLKLSNKQFRMTMKPMMISLILIIIVLPFLAEMYGDKIVTLENNKGSLTLDEKTYDLELTEEKLILENTECKIPCNDQAIGDYKWDINLEGENSVKFSRIVVLLPFSLPFFGNDFGWLFWYILTSLILNSLFRRILGVEI
ncbi:MAG: DUF106 domain-containing protein [Candidatus Aenigmarchaeota archaeon]|nr:DUF106 domain-containing protein [Candidatus Aenigmarchaeota archaeon]